MTTWTTIVNEAVAVGGIPASSTVTALRDNPISIAEQSSGSPVLFSGWQAYDKVSNGDAARGLLWDFAVSGTRTSVETPNFEDGWEYRIIAIGLSASSGNGGGRVQLYGETLATWDSVSTFGVMSTAGDLSSFDVEILFPRLVKNAHFARNSGGYYTTSTSTWNETTDTPTATACVGPSSTRYYTTAQKILKARAQLGSLLNLNAGKVYLFRRREYASLA
jgi:hypothetical protein